MKRSATLALAAAFLLALAGWSSPAVASTPAGCTDQLTTVETTSEQGDETTIVITMTVAATTFTTCPETLTADPSSAAPGGSVTVTLAGAQPQICTTSTTTVVTHHRTPQYDANGVLVGYEDVVIATQTSTIISCRTNSAVVRFDGLAVATTTATQAGLVATFTVPSSSPGAHTITATPVAGTVATAPFTVLDAVPPFITGIASPPANAAGWNSGDVFVSFLCDDVDSGIQTCTDTVTLSTEGAGQSVTGTAVDTAGNTATYTVSGINIDRTGPTIEPHASRPPDHGVWYTAPVTIDFDCEDALSGIAVCSGPVTLSTDGRGVLYTAEAFDKAGNGLEFANNVNIDQLPPTITAPAPVAAATSPGTCAAAPTLGAAAAADDLGVVAVANNAPALFAKGTTTVTWTATDPAGNSASATQPVTVSDLERPTVHAPLSVNAIAAGGSGLVIATAALGSASVSDNCPNAGAATVSGIPAGNLFPIGSTTLTWSATDASGNTGTATQTVTVSYGLCLLYDPTKAAQPGSAIPIKVQLCTAGGANQSAASLLPRAVDALRGGAATPVSVSAAGNANPDGVFRYDASLGGSGGYIYNLDTTGLASGSWQLRFSVNGQTYSVPFQVKE